MCATDIERDSKTHQQGSIFGLMKGVLIAACARKQWVYTQDIIICVFTLAIPHFKWLRYLVPGLSRRRHWFNTRPLHVWFVMEKLTLEQVFLQVHRLSHASVIHM